MSWLRRNPIAWYVVIFAAVIAWGITRQTPGPQPVTAGAASATYATPGPGPPPARPEVRRVAQRMLLR